MITLRPITEENFLFAAGLRVKQEQNAFVQPAPMILGRAYAYRNQRAVCWAIFNEEEIVGLALIHDMNEEPACYHLCEFMIDETHQGKGCATEALRLILTHCRREGRFPRVELSVKKENLRAIHVYRKAGFRDTGYQDPSTPDCICMVCDLRAEIRYRNIVLRDMIEADIEDWIRWDSIDTEWMDWDAPDEPAEEIDAEEYRRDLQDFINAPREDAFRSFFELENSDGQHLGRINSYVLTDDFEYGSWPEDLNENTKVAIGIDICNAKCWNRGYGRNAIVAFVQHYLKYNITQLFLQTWSGNIRMVPCAEKIGFVECNRIVGNRHIRGGIYDSLTFQLDLDRFRKYLEENP